MSIYACFARRWLIAFCCAWVLIAAATLPVLAQAAGGGEAEKIKQAVVGQAYYGNPATLKGLNARNVTEVAVTPAPGNGVCRYMDIADNKNIFIPFASATEWNAFVQNIGASDVYMDLCRPVYNLNSVAPGGDGTAIDFAGALDLGTANEKATSVTPATKIAVADAPLRRIDARNDGALATFKADVIDRAAPTAFTMTRDDCRLRQFPPGKTGPAENLCKQHTWTQSAAAHFKYTLPAGSDTRAGLLARVRDTATPANIGTWGMTFSRAGDSVPAFEPPALGTCAPALHNQHHDIVEQTGVTVSLGCGAGYTGSNTETYDLKRDYYCFDGIDYPWGSQVEVNKTTSNLCVPIINGEVGAANGATLAAMPATGLCAYTATTPVVSGDGSEANPWTWTCTGSNGGGDVTGKAFIEGGSCPGINFAAEGDMKWSYPSYCNPNGGPKNFEMGHGMVMANWNGGAVVANAFAECTFPNWPRNDGTNGSGWTGINFPGPNPASTAGGGNWTPLPGYVGQDHSQSPLFPYAAIRDKDYAAGVDHYHTYPGMTPVNYEPGPLRLDMQFPIYLPNDVAVAVGMTNGSQSEITDLQQAIDSAIGVGTTWVGAGNLVFLSCNGAAGGRTYEDCFATHALIPGAKGEVVSKTYPNGDSWSFQISGPDANGGCFYNADNNADWSYTAANNWKFNGSDHGVGSCHVKVAFTRPGTSKACSAKGNGGGIPEEAYCGANNVTGYQGPNAVCDKTGQTPMAPNTSSAVGPQTCAYECYNGTL